MSLELEPGAVFEKKYRIVERIGKGGMAQIYRVESLDLDSIHYALKLIRIPDDDPALRADFLARFRREAEILWRLRGKRNAHIVDVHAYSETSELGIPYLLLEYLEGRDLEHLLADRGRLPVDTVLVLARQMVSALEAIHAAGIVHRDLSPQNFFICEEPGAEGEVTLHAKLLDFGVAKSLRKSDAMLTHVNTFVGKPAYASPEQLMMISDLDARSDQFSLAAIVFEMLTGERAFMRAGDSPQACCRRVISSDPLLEIESAHELPDALRAVLQCALSKQPQNRYPTTRQFLRALEVEPGNRQALFHLAAISYRRGVMEATKRYLSELHEGGEPTAESLWLSIRVEHRLGDRAAEASLVQQLRRRFPASPEFQAFLQGQYK